MNEIQPTAKKITTEKPQEANIETLLAYNLDMKKVSIYFIRKLISEVQQNNINDFESLYQQCNPTLLPILGILTLYEELVQTLDEDSTFSNFRAELIHTLNDSKLAANKKRIILHIINKYWKINELQIKKQYDNNRTTLGQSEYEKLCSFYIAAINNALVAELHDGQTLLK